MDTIDARLVKLAKSGEKDAFAQIVERYKTKIYHLSYRMLGNRQEAEDITQETFLRIHMSLDRYEGTYKFSTWIYRIGTNLCIDQLRKRKKKWFSLDADSMEGEGLDGYAFLQSNEKSPESQLILTESQQEIRKAIDSLPEKYKSVIVLRYMHDQNLEEISEILALPVTTVKTRVHRGREYLRRKFKQSDIF